MDDLTQNTSARAVARRLLSCVMDGWTALADLQTMVPEKDLSLDDAEAVCGGIVGGVVTGEAVTALLTIYTTPEDVKEVEETEDDCANCGAPTGDPTRVYCDACLMS